MVTSGGTSSIFPVDYIRVPEPSALVFAGDFGAIGAATGAALGAALGRPDRLTALFIGDGSLMLTLSDMDTAYRYRIPLLIVCMNDGAYGSEVSIAQRHGMSGAVARFDSRPIADMASAMGIPSRVVRNLDGLSDLADLARTLAGPYLLDCAIPTAVSRVVGKV